VRPTDDDIAKGLTNIQVDRTIAGLSPAECIRFFHSDCRDMKSEYLSVRTDFDKKVLSALDQTWELHRSGWMLTPEYTQFSQKAMLNAIATATYEECVVWLRMSETRPIPRWRP
jgi:hypothetical protein